MLSSKYSSNPYETTRPKTFFGDRKKMYVDEITTGSGGKSYDPSWNANRKPSTKMYSKRSNTHSAVMLITPISIFACVLLISVLAVM